MGHPSPHKLEAPARQSDHLLDPLGAHPQGLAAQPAGQRRGPAADRRLVRLLSGAIAVVAAACGVTANEQAVVPAANVPEEASLQPVEGGRPAGANVPAKGAADGGNVAATPTQPNVPVHVYGLSMTAGAMTLAGRGNDVVAVVPKQLAAAIAANWLVEGSLSPNGFAFAELCLTAKPNVSTSPAVMLKGCQDTDFSDRIFVDPQSLSIRSWTGVDTSSCPDPTAAGCRLTFNTNQNNALGIAPSVLAPPGEPRGTLIRTAKRPTHCLAKEKDAVVLRACDANSVDQRWLASGPLTGRQGMRLQNEGGGCLDAKNANSLVVVDCALSMTGWTFPGVFIRLSSANYVYLNGNTQNNTVSLQQESKTYGPTVDGNGWWWRFGP